MGVEGPALDRAQSTGRPVANVVADSAPDSVVSEASAAPRSTRSSLYASAAAASSPRENFKRRSLGLDSPRVKRQLLLAEGSEVQSASPALEAGSTPVAVAMTPPKAAAIAEPNCQFQSPGGLGADSASGLAGGFETPSPPSRRVRPAAGYADAARDEPQASTSGRNASAPTAAPFSPDPTRMTLDEVAAWVTYHTYHDPKYPPTRITKSLPHPQVPINLDLLRTIRFRSGQ